MTPSKQWKNTHLKGASMVTQCLWRVIVWRISQQMTGIFYPSLSTLQKIMIFFHLNCGLWKRGRTKLSLMPPPESNDSWIKNWLLWVSGVRPHRAPRSSAGPLAHPLQLSILQSINWILATSGKDPYTTGLSKGSKLALQLAWFPFYAPFWKLGFHFVFLYRALSCSI